MLHKIFTLSLFIFASSTAFAQIGIIKGNIKDAASGEAIIGANVVIEGTTQGASTDIEGNFEITKVKAGKYNIVVTYISYKNKTIPNVDVYPDQATVINTSIEEDVQQLEDVVITATRQTNTDISVITELKKADLIAVGISSQMIQMSQDRDASQVIRRVPGVTIVGNRFVNVRGLSERYSTVMLNGIIAPSTEIDSKAFAFDLIPSNMIDRMLVFKSGSPELPGEFAGADINIYTKNIVEENSASISVFGSFRANTTGQEFEVGQLKSKWDWAGFGGDARALPKSFPAQSLRSLSMNNGSDANTLINATKSLPDNWSTRAMTASPDFRVNFDISRTVRLGRMKLDNITALSYAHTNQRMTNVQQNFYDVGTGDPRFLFRDTRYSQINRSGAISNFTLEINPSNKIEFRNFYNQQGQNSATVRTGLSDGTSGFDANNLSTNYFSRGIYSGQLAGKHALSDAINFNWVLGYNNTRADQPDYMRVRSQRSIGTDSPYEVQIPPTASSNDAGRFFSKLKEEAYTFAGNLDIKLNPSAEESKQSKIITGYYLEKKDRAFDARWMSYKWILGKDDFRLTRQAPSQVFAPENLGTSFILEEGTNIGPSSFDRYDGHNQLAAGYAGIVTPIGDKWRLTGGVRVEYNRQLIDVYAVDSLDNTKVNKLNKKDSKVVVPMPFLNLSYNFSEKMLVRIAYSKTVNRPVFRELAPFNYYDFDRNADVYGNPNLKTARIDNVDLKWELYPSRSENITFGVFYKNFKDPIEQYLTSGSNFIYSFLNAKTANNYGVEAEIRKSLEGLNSNFLKRLTFVFNGALIRSAITIPDVPKYRTLERNRAMQGQSPYIVNASIFYNHPEQGWQASVMYNVFGKRIFAVGDDSGNPTQYEMPRNQIDVTITKQLGEHLELKVGVADILNQSYRLIQDNNRDKQISEAKGDQLIQKLRYGQYGTLGLTWRF